MLAADLDCGLLGFEACILRCCPSTEQDGSVYPPRAKGLRNDLATNLVVVVEHACVCMFACERHTCTCPWKPSLAAEAGPLTEASAYSGLLSLFPSHMVYRETPHPPGLYTTSGESQRWSDPRRADVLQAEPTPRPPGYRFAEVHQHQK